MRTVMIVMSTGTATRAGFITRWVFDMASAPHDDYHVVWAVCRIDTNLPRDVSLTSPVADVPGPVSRRVAQRVETGGVRPRPTTPQLASRTSVLAPFGRPAPVQLSFATKRSEDRQLGMLLVNGHHVGEGTATATNPPD